MGAEVKSKVRKRNGQWQYYCPFNCCCVWADADSWQQALLLALSHQLLHRERIAAALDVPRTAVYPFPKITSPGGYI